MFFLMLDMAQALLVELQDRSDAEVLSTSAQCSGCRAHDQQHQQI